MSNKQEQAESQNHESPAVEEVKTLDQIINKPPKEYGGPAGLEPTRYGDWERKGRCIDF
ncbi:MAG: DUF1674 domain-containing protein [Oceanococcus sp.]